MSDKHFESWESIGVPDNVEFTTHSFKIKPRWYERKPWSRILNFFMPTVTTHFRTFTGMDKNGNNVTVHSYMRYKTTVRFWKMWLRTKI